VSGKKKDLLKYTDPILKVSVFVAAQVQWNQVRGRSHTWALGEGHELGTGAGVQMECAVHKGLKNAPLAPALDTGRGGGYAQS
jgi:hypothetical protein